MEIETRGGGGEAFAASRGNRMLRGVLAFLLAGSLVSGGISVLPAQAYAADDSSYSLTDLLTYAGDDSSQEKSGDDAQTDSATMVSIIVQLEGSAAAESNSSKGLFGLFSTTKDHTYYKNRIRSLAESVENENRSAAGSNYSLQSTDSSRSNTAGSDSIVELYDYYHAFNGFAIKAPAGTLSRIRELDGVKNAFIESTFTADDTQDEDASTNTGLDNQSSRDMVGLDEVSDTGKGMLVAVIDSGMDTAHEAFQGEMDADSVAWSQSTAQAKRAQCVQGGRKAQYVSAKIPFAYDYGDKDDNVYPSTVAGNHGAHVAGIVAANAGKVRGAAPDAQIAFMKVANDFNGAIYESTLFAALDDAAAIAPDVINMSLGSDGGFSAAASNTYDDIFTTLEQEGCTICVSAGNSYASTYENTHNGLALADSPDEGIVASPASAGQSFAVASAENATARAYFTAADGTKIAYVNGSRSEGTSGQDFEDLADGTYSYVDCGNATDDDVAALRKQYGSLRGKIALVEDYSSSGFSMSGNRVSNISALRPTAIILYNSDAGGLDAKNIGGNTRPVACITRADGLVLRDASDKTLTIAQGKTLAPSTDYSMNAFSSWGTTPEMGMKPEITAVGGNVYSTVLNDQYDYKSGTSMASPQMAGLSAVLRSHLESDQRFASYSDDDKRKAVTQLLMSTAHPLKDTAHGSYYSPRRQGAGLADIADAEKTTVYATVDGASDEARPKAELGESADGSWQFTVTLHNVGDTDASYRPDTCALSEAIEDGLFQQYSKDYAGKGIEVSYGGAAYDAQSGTVTVSAGASASYTVSITCEDAFKEAVADAKNGTFVEGFAQLKNLDSEGVDLSVPYLGFYGSWGAASLFDAVKGSDQKAEYYAARLVNAQSEDELGANPLLDDEDAEADAANATISNVNDDAAPHSLTPRTGLLRGASSLTYTYKNAAGTAVNTYEYPYVSRSRVSSSDTSARYAESSFAVTPDFTGTSDKGAALADGTYTLEITGVTAGQNASTQSISESFIYDTTSPTVSVQQTGDTLTVTASDNHNLAGIDLHDPSTGNYFYRLTADKATEAKESDNGTVYTFEIPLADVAAAWKEAGNSSEVPETVPVYAWDYGLNEASTQAETSASPFSIDQDSHELTAYAGNDANVVIPDGVTKIGDGAFEGSSVVSVSVPASVQAIGEEAFADTAKLKQITFQGSDDGSSQLTEIGTRAFAGSALPSIELPPNVKTLGTAVFKESSLQEAWLGASLTQLPANAFQDSSLETVGLPDGLTSIGDDAFAGCESLTSVLKGTQDNASDGTPGALKSIGKRAFEDTGLSSIQLNDGLYAIGASAFADSALRTLVVPDSVSQADAKAFADMDKLQHVQLGANITVAQATGMFATDTGIRDFAVSESSSELSAHDGVLFNADGTLLVAFPGARAGSYTVPDSVTAVADQAFAGSALSHIALSEHTGTVIGARAFEAAEIESADLGAATEIGISAFANCSNLTAVDLRSDLNRLTTIESSAFTPGTPIAQVSIPDSVTSIGSRAFANNAALTTVYLGAGTAADFSSVFAGCENVEQIQVSADNEMYQADGSVLYRNESDGMHLVWSSAKANLSSYTVQSGTVAIDARAFQGNTALTQLVLPEGLKSIGSAAFSGCTALAQVQFPDSLETVTGFWNTAIDEAEFGSNIVSIASSAFNGHNPSRLVVKGGKSGTYASSMESGSDSQPIKYAEFGEGMVSVDFTTSSIAPPTTVVVPSTMTKLSLNAPSESLVYDPAQITVYAPKDSAGWKAARAALTAIGADVSTQLKEQKSNSSSDAKTDTDKKGSDNSNTGSAAQKKTTKAKKTKTVKQGSSVTVKKMVYQVSSVKKRTVVLKKARNAKSDTIPAKVKLTDGKTYAVVGIAKKAFAKAKKCKKVVVKTKKLTKKSVKGAFKGSKVNKMVVRVGTKKVNKTYVKKYQKVFTKANCGKKVKVVR